jgi:26S proteasome regulatory subunit N5
MEEIKKNKIKNKDKMQQDFSEITLKTIEEQTKVAYSGKLNEAIENLLLLEKQTRQSEDYINTSKIAITIIKLCYELKNFKFLNENLIILSKRRGQLRTVIKDIVRESMNYLDKLDKNIKLELINTLKQITEGKIFVEIERARLIKILAKIKEEEGKINEAADILQEIQVKIFLLLLNIK